MLLPLRGRKRRKRRLLLGRRCKNRLNRLMLLLRRRKRKKKLLRKPNSNRMLNNLHKRWPNQLSLYNNRLSKRKEKKRKMTRRIPL